MLSTRHEGVQDITLSEWKDNGDGSYTQILTTGAMSGTLTLMPQLNGVDAAKAPRRGEYHFYFVIPNSLVN